MASADRSRLAATPATNSSHKPSATNWLASRAAGDMSERAYDSAADLYSPIWNTCTLTFSFSSNPP